MKRFYMRVLLNGFGNITLKKISQCNADFLFILRGKNDAWIIHGGTRKITVYSSTFF